MKIIAYYLPQFHETPYNNEWWGKGFTEWTNVKKAEPLFAGHNEPRVPLNNNYYSLDNVDTLRWQSHIASEYGIYGFCMYHYWFNGKLLLNKPIELLRKHEEINIHYCLCWANENWTNGWVDSNNKILIASDFDDEHDWDKHFEYFLRFFNDKRYIRIDDKPVIIIYYPSLIRKLNKLIDRWRYLAVRAGYKGLTVIYQHSLFALDRKADKNMFDYGIEFEPTYSEYTLKGVDTSAVNRHIHFTTFVRTIMNINPRKSYAINGPTKISYDAVWKEALLQKLPTNVFPGAFVDWDNTPRKGKRGSTFVGSSPEKFEHYFNMLVQKAKYIERKDYLFIFSWNEWGEGGYLEPDEKWKFSYLEAVKRCLEANGEGFQTNCLKDEFEK